MSAAEKLVDKKILKTLVPLNGLSSVHFDEVARKAIIENIGEGKFIFRKGERDNTSVYVLSGEVALMDGRDTKLTIEGGTEEARHPIAPQHPRQLTARAKTKATIMRIDSGLLDVMLAWDQSSSYEVSDIHGEEEEDWMTRMLQSELLQRLPAMNLQQLIMRMEEIEVEAGMVIVNQDDDGDYYYIIKNGSCVVSRKTSSNSKPVKLAELRSGDSFGEESLLSGSKRNATVTMLTKGYLMRLAKQDFDELLKEPLLNRVSFEASKKIIQNGGIYLDVRLPGEFSNQHLPDSINIPLAAIRSEALTLDKSIEYVIYCDTGRRSSSAAFILGQMGFETHVLEGGANNLTLEDIGSEEGATSAKTSAEIIDFRREGNAAGVSDEQVKKLRAEAEDLKNKLQNAQENLAQQEENLKQMQAAEQARASELEALKKGASAGESLEKEKKKILGELEKARKAEGKARDEMDDLREQLKETQAELQEVLQASQENDKQAVEIRNKLNAIQEENRRLVEVEKDHRQLRDELDTLTVQYKSLEEVRGKLQAQLENLEHEKESIGKDIDGNIAELNQEIEQLRQQLVATEQAHKQAEEAHSKANQAFEQSKADLQAAIQQQEKTENEKNLLLQELENLKQDRESISQGSEQRLEELRSKLQQTEKQLQEQQAAQVQLEKTLSEAQQQLEVKNQEQNQLQSVLEAANQEKESLEQQLVSQQEAHSSRDQQAESQLAQLREQLQTLEQQIQQDVSARVKAEKALAVSSEENDRQQQVIQQLQQDLEARKQEGEAQAAEHQARVQQLEQQLAEQQQSQAESEQQIQSLQEQVQQASNERQQTEIARLELEQQISTVKLNTENRIKEADARLLEMESTLKEAQTRAEEMARQRDQSDRMLAERLSEGERLRKELEQIQRQGADSVDTEHQIVALQEQLEVARKEIEQLQGLAVELDTVRLQFTALQGELEESRSAVEHLKGQADESVASEQKLAELQEQLEISRKELEEAGERVALANKDREALLSELQGYREQLDQSNGEQSEKLAYAEAELASVEEKYQALKVQFEAEKSGRRDNEASRQLLENEIDELREESDKLRNALEQARQGSDQLQQQLETLQQEQKSNLEQDNSEEILMRLNLAQERVTDLERESENLRAETGHAGRKIEMLEAELERARKNYDQNSALSDEIESLKRDMEERLERYKNEVDEEAVKYRDENQQLRRELEKLHKEHDLAIKTGAPTARGRPMEIPEINDIGETSDEEAPRRPQRRQPDPVKSDLFAIADVDRNLFHQPAAPSAKKSPWLTIVLVLLFSALAAGGMYFYMNIQNPATDTAVTPAVSVPEKKAAPAAVAPKEVKTSKASVKAEQKPVVKVPVVTAPVVTAAKQDDGLLRPLRTYRDFIKAGGNGPVMVEVPAGQFDMGSPSSSFYFDERPQRRVVLQKFSISKYEVTFEDYGRFASATGRGMPSSSGWGTGKRPVINISWNDANAYAKWLSQQTGHRYRLPTEAEWEYAARAGTKTKYWWGVKPGQKNANCFNCGSQWDRNQTAPVGSFKANSLGLHDMSGNVEEWVSDCYHDNYNGAPRDGSAWNETTCDKRVVRGGSYLSTSENVRVTKRSGFAANHTQDSIGFRLVRE